MINLLPLLHSDKEREMKTYSDKGYCFREGKNQYQYINLIRVIVSKDEQYVIQIRYYNNEPRFYLTQFETYSYLSIEEIYQVLLEWSKDGNNDVVKKILGSDCDTELEVLYVGVAYSLHFFNEGIPDSRVALPHTQLTVPIRLLFILIALIQEKSNYFWLNSTEANRKYINGFIRFLYCLTFTKDHPYFKSMGWKYNSSTQMYSKMPDAEYKDIKKRASTKSKDGKDISVRYYLTEKEQKTIMRRKKS